MALCRGLIRRYRDFPHTIVARVVVALTPGDDVAQGHVSQFEAAAPVLLAVAVDADHDGFVDVLAKRAIFFNRDKDEGSRMTGYLFIPVGVVPILYVVVM